MATIAIFDSGFGSLSIIKSIQKVTKANIIYFADQKNFPYGKKSKAQLRKIILSTIRMLKKQFNPDLIVLGSNTPSLLLEDLNTTSVLTVLPPLKEAAKISKTSNIAILATQSATQSKELSAYIKKNHLPKKIKIIKINASPLVELVEWGLFIDDKKTCRRLIKKVLKEKFIQNKVDVVTLSSTHLPFLLPFLQSEFPNVTFIDPANGIANKIAKIISKKKSKRNTIKIFTSSNPRFFQNYLHKLGVKNKVNFLFSL